MSIDRVQHFAETFLFQKYRVVRYLTSGGTAAAANLLILYTLTEFFHVWYLASSVAGVLAGWLVSFTLQKFWTFRNFPLDRVHIQLPLHISLSAVNIVLNTTFLAALVEVVGIWYIAAQLLVSAALACMNYVIYRRFIFS